MHLTTEEFIDAAEGARSEGSLPHLFECGACRRALSALRATLAAAASEAAAARGEAPEPSPLFWNSLSARINAAIDVARATRRQWWLAWTRPHVLVPLSAVAVLALVVATAPDPRVPWRMESPRATSIPVVTTAAAVEPASDAVDLAPDPLLTLVSDLSANMDWDSAAAAGLAERGSADHAVTHMNTDELRALKQLLETELGRPGA